MGEGKGRYGPVSGTEVGAEVEIHGLLPLYKPSGVVSKDVSRQVARVLGSSVRMGHVGTLDPMAEGVLPLVLGRATRLQDYLLQTPKVYDVTCVFGVTTDTLDRTGKVVERAEFPQMDRAGVQRVLESMVGVRMQTPPLYSAVKYQGQALYRYARQGRADIPLQSLQRSIEIYEMQLGECVYGPGAQSQDLMSMSFTVTCSKGTYVRSLCDEVARQLGSLATTSAIVRLESAGIQTDQCVRWQEGQDRGEESERLRARLLAALIPIGAMSLPFSKMRVSVRVKEELGHGRVVQGVSVGGGDDEGASWYPLFEELYRLRCREREGGERVSTKHKGDGVESMILVVDYEGSAVCLGKLKIGPSRLQPGGYEYFLSQKRGLL